MAIWLSTATRNAMLDEINTAIGASGKLRIYSGTRPAGGGTATTLLAELPLGATAFAAATGGTMTANAITDDTSADASGTATWYRALTSGNTAVIDGDVGTSGSDCNLNTTTIVAGGTVEVTSWVLTAGGG